MAKASARRRRTPISDRPRPREKPTGDIPAFFWRNAEQRLLLMEERTSRLLASKGSMTRITVVYDEGHHPWKLATTGRELLLDRWGRPLEKE